MVHAIHSQQISPATCRWAAGARTARRGLVGLLAVTLLAGSAARWAPAEAATPASFQTITAPNSTYQLQVPWDWKQKATDGAPTEGSDGSVGGLDTILVAPDSRELVLSMSVSGGPSDQYSVAELPQQAEASLQSLGPALQDQGAGAITEIGTPKTVTVANADGAIEVTGSFAGKDGPRIVTMRLAVQGQTMHAISVFAPTDFSQSDPAFATIISSFALAPAAGQAAPAH